MSSELDDCKRACAKTITEAAFAAGDAAAARAIADGGADEPLWKRVFADTDAVDLLAPVLREERATWIRTFVDTREHIARCALERLQQQACSWAALDSLSVRQAAAALAASADKISADEGLDAIIRAAAARALADAARILADAAH
jgi:hypothetical protein